MEMEESAILEKDENFVIKKTRKKNWTNPKEMEAYLNLLDENAKELSSLKRNYGVYHRMSYKMANLGFQREPYELRKKLSNIFWKYKIEKSQENSEWPYLQRVHQILSKMKRYNPNRFLTAEKELAGEDESSSVKLKNEIQKLLVITPGTSVRIDEADMETILKAMNGEDISSKNDDSSASIEDTGNRTVDSSQVAEIETDDDSMYIDLGSETPNDSPHKTTTPGSPSEKHEVNDKTVALFNGTNREVDDPRKKKVFSVTKDPVIIKECANKSSEEDEVDLYTTLLAAKLKSMDEKTRHIAMNKIDNFLFEMKMQQYES